MIEKVEFINVSFETKIVTEKLMFFKKYRVRCITSLITYYLLRAYKHSKILEYYSCSIRQLPKLQWDQHTSHN